MGDQNSAYYTSQAPRTMPSWHMVHVNNYVAVGTWAKDFIFWKLVICLLYLEEEFLNPSNLSILECKKSAVFGLNVEEGRIRRQEREKKRGKDRRPVRDQGWARVRESQRPYSWAPLIFCFTQSKNKDFPPLLILSVPRLSLWCARCGFPGS